MSWFNENLGLSLPALLILIGAISGAIGAILINRDSTRQQMEIAALNKKIAEKSEKIAELNEQIAGSVTGGDSFCYLFPEPASDKLNTINFKIQHRGKYPVYDIYIRVWDDSCLGRIDSGQLWEKHFGYKTKEVTEEESLKMEKDPKYIAQRIALDKEERELMRNCLIFQGNLGTITPNTSTTNIMDDPLFSYTLPKGGDLSKLSQEFTLDIRARNGQYNQKIKLDIRNKGLHIYSKVEKVVSDSQRIVVAEYESQGSDPFVILIIK